MVNTKELGQIGESMACDSLRKKGYTILRRNYIFNHSEIDIIAEFVEKLVFVEVKTRNSSFLTDPSLLVSIGKQKQIIKAADQYVKDFYPEKEWRFDIIVVITNSEYTSIEHIEDAFYPMA
jgi:putative endonuclease